MGRLTLLEYDLTAEQRNEVRAHGQFVEFNLQKLMEEDGQVKIEPPPLRKASEEGSRRLLKQLEIKYPYWKGKQTIDFLSLNSGETPYQIQIEVAELFALRQRLEFLTGSSGGKAEGIENTTPSKDEAALPQPADLTDGENLAGTDRRAAINAFILKVTESGRKITRKDIWTVAGYKVATEFQRFQRNDLRTTVSATIAFNRVLSMKPEDFIRSLEKKPAQE